MRLPANELQCGEHTQRALSSSHLALQIELEGTGKLPSPGLRLIIFQYTVLPAFKSVKRESR